MSTKSTVLYLPFCHIYVDHIGSNGDETFCIEVDRGHLGELDMIEVEGNSEFAKLIKYLLKDKTEQELLRAVK